MKIKTEREEGEYYFDDFDIDISDIDTIEERLDVYYRMKRKYGPEVEDVLNFLFCINSCTSFILSSTFFLTKK